MHTYIHIYIYIHTYIHTHTESRGYSTKPNQEQEVTFSESGHLFVKTSVIFPPRAAAKERLQSLSLQGPDLEVYRAKKKGVRVVKVYGLGRGVCVCVCVCLFVF